MQSSLSFTLPFIIPGSALLSSIPPGRMIPPKGETSSSQPTHVREIFINSFPPRIKAALSDDLTPMSKVFNSSDDFLSYVCDYSFK